MAAPKASLPDRRAKMQSENTRAVVVEKNISLTGRIAIGVTSDMLGHAEIRRCNLLALKGRLYKFYSGQGTSINLDTSYGATSKARISASCLAFAGTPT